MPNVPHTRKQKLYPIEVGTDMRHTPETKAVPARQTKTELPQIAEHVSSDTPLLAAWH